MAARKARSYVFTSLGILSILVALGVLLTLILDVLVRGLLWLDWQFISSFDSRFAERAGIKAALFGTAYMMFFTILLSLPLGVMSAIYLEEYSTDSRLNRFIELNISNLAGVPSIIYGLLGLQVFVRWFDLERSVLAGSLTMALLAMPTIIVAAREAIRAVPSSIRDASYALGATRWQTVWYHVLPNAFGGILTGNILAASRAIGETAPLITIGALTFVLFTPDNPMDTFTVLPIVLFNWVSKPQSEFHDIAAAGIVVLLLVLLTMNSVAIILRARLRRRR
ncbi:MAG TPA: phosphate ABC transporter permease PstA [Chloroflexia bacterium]